MVNLIGPGQQIDPLTGLPIDPRLKLLLAAQVFGPQEVQQQSANDLPSRQRFLEQNAAGRATVAQNSTPTPAPRPADQLPSRQRFLEQNEQGRRNRGPATPFENDFRDAVTSPVQALMDQNILEGTADYFLRPERPATPAASTAGYVPEGWGGGAGGGGGGGRGNPFTMSVESLRPVIVAQESRGRYNAINHETGALGAYQVMPDTGRVLAQRLGLPWKPDLMRQDTVSGRAYQDKIGGAAIQEAIEASGGDLATMAMYYHGGSNRDIWGPRTQQYAQDILARVGGGGGMTAAAMMGGENPYTASGAAALDQQRLADFDTAMTNAQKPSSTTFASPFQEMPTPTAVPGRDFSRSDAALEAMRPAEVLEQDKRKMIHQGIFAGMAQAMAATPDGAGLGKVLAMFGAGALGGNVQGNEDVQRRMDRYEALMAQFHTAQYNNETNKSDAAWRQASAQADQDNRYAANRFERWVKDNNVTVTNDGTVVNTYRTSDGEMRTDTTSIPALAEQARIMRRLDLTEGIAGRMANGQAVVSGMRNGITSRMADYELAQGGSGNSQLLTGTMMVQQAVENGTIWNFLDEEDKEAIDEEWMKHSASMSLTGETALQQKAVFVENMIIGMVMQPENKPLWDQIRGSAGQTAESIATRQARQASTTRTNNRITTRTPGSDF